eukprot:8729224-Pyramimonas_sp.AAC.1
MPETSSFLCVASSARMRAPSASPLLSACGGNLGLLLASSPRICLMSSRHGEVVLCALSPEGER